MVEINIAAGLFTQICILLGTILTFHVFHCCINILVYNDLVYSSYGLSCLHCIVQGKMYDFQTDRILICYYSDTGLICVMYKFSVAHFNDIV